MGTIFFLDIFEILEIFIFRKEGLFYVEYESKYQEIIDENFNFSITMLDLCKNQREAQTILKAPKVFIQIIIHDININL